MADDMAVIYRRYRPETYSPQVIKSKHKNYSRQNADGKTTKRFSNVHEPRSNATQKKSKSSFRERPDIIITVKQNKRKHKRKKSSGQQIPQRPQLSVKRSTCLTTEEYLKILTKKCSTPIKHDLEDDSSYGMKRTRSDSQLNTSTPYQTKFIVNTLSLDPNILQPEHQHVLNHPLMQARLRIYRCQLSANEESCCCLCNSDAMFEVMKGLYDCYKNKNCGHCNCILCGHLPKQERKLGEARKLLTSVGVETDTAKQIRKDKLKKAKEAGFLTPLAGKTPEQREKVLRGLANLGLPLPEGKTPSQKALIGKVKQDLGIPPIPKSAAEQEKLDKVAKLGFLQPPESKSKPEKEKKLQNLNDIGIELPESRSPSEKSLIAKIKAGPKELALSQSQKMVKARGANLSLPLTERETPSPKQVIDKVRKELGLPPEPKSAAERKKQEDAAKLGILMPLEGKSSCEKEKLHWHDKGIELPEGRGPSEKAKDLAVTQSQKLAKAKAAGLLSPLAGKSPEEKEKKLRGLVQSGLPLPAGTTESEKKLIAKIAEESKGLSPSKVDKATPFAASEKLRRAKAAGLLTTLDKKTPEQKEKILRGLAMMGLPLPEGKTPSDIKLLGNVRNDLGLPPDPKNIAEKDKYIKAQAAGIIKSLEGKTPAEKEKILRTLAGEFIPLPIGRTPSEKAQIKIILAETKQVPLADKNASEKLHKATLACLSIPLQGKTPEQKEKILRDIAIYGGLLPDGNTSSEIKLIDIVRKDLGLPSIPKTDAEKDKYTKAQAAGLMFPLEAKTPEQKEKILRKLVEKNIPLPKGRTASEKSLIKKIQADVKSVSSKAKFASERLRKAKAAGLAVSLTGKSPEKKAQMLHNLANRGYPLPEGKTASEKALIDSIRKTLDEQTAKNITEGKGPGDECICHILAPESVSEARESKSAGIVTAKKSTLSVSEAAGLLSPLEGKSPADRERILRGLVISRLPLPEGKTPSLKALTDKIRKEMGLPLEPQSPAMKEKLRKGYAGGIVTPLNSKTLAQKENILKKLNNAGLDLPEGRTASEKSLIIKIKPSKAGIGITIPLVGKTPSQKETILKKMAIAGVPLPDGRTHSEKAIIAKLVTNLLMPLKGKNPKEQEKILKWLLKADLPLPEGTTPSEKALIKKVKDRFDAGKRSKSAAVLTKLPGKSVVRIISSGVSVITQSAKLRKAKAAGLLTPLKGKGPKTQEKILKGLLKAGFPLPEGTTPSEKALIKRVQDEFDAAIKAGGLSPEGLVKTDSAKIRRAKASGLVNSLKGKTSEEKRKIITDLILVSLSPLKVTTPSAKEMVKKFEADAAKAAKGPAQAGLPVPEGGDTRSKKPLRKSKGTLAAVGAGIQEEIQGIVKTDKCDAACGCGKKKIRFKHSYVKIRVTSPDNSSFRPCTNKCIPGVKAGVFTDNEGIKVTVGNVGIPSYTVHPQITKRNSLENKHSLQSFKDIDNLIKSQSLLSLKISLIGSDCATDNLNSSKSTVYIFNSQSDVSISDIERLLRLTLNNDNLKKEFKFETSGEKKPVSYIYRSRFSDSSGDFRSCLRIAPCTLHLSSSSLRSLYTNTIYETESSLSHAADLPISMTTYNSDTLRKVSYIVNHLQYSSQSINMPQSTERVDDMGSTSTNTLPRKSQSYKYSNRKVDITNYLGEFSSQLVAKGDTSCASPHSRNRLRGIKRNTLALVRKVPSNKSFSSSSVFMVISTSGHGDGSSYLHASDTLSNLTHSEPSSLLFMNKRPHISLLTLNMFICSKFISKAKAQRDLWKRKKAEAVLRLRNMAQKLVLQTQKELGRQRYVHPHVPVCTSNKYTSSTVASQEQERVEHTVDKTGVFGRKWMASRGNRAAYQTKHIDTRIHRFSSPSSYCPSNSTVSTTLHSPQVYVNSQVTTNNSVSIFDEILSCKTDNAPVKLRKTCTFAMSAGVGWNSPQFSVHRMKTCY